MKSKILLLFGVAILATGLLGLSGHRQVRADGTHPLPKCCPACRFVADGDPKPPPIPHKPHAMETPA